MIVVPIHPDEARINAWLSHSNIVQVLELGEKVRRSNFIAEYVCPSSVAHRRSPPSAWAKRRGGAVSSLRPARPAPRPRDQASDGSRWALTIATSAEPLLTHEGFATVVDFGTPRPDAPPQSAPPVRSAFVRYEPRAVRRRAARAAPTSSPRHHPVRVAAPGGLFRRAPTRSRRRGDHQVRIPDPRSTNPTSRRRSSPSSLGAGLPKPRVAVLPLRRDAEYSELVMRRKRHPRNWRWTCRVYRVELPIRCEQEDPSSAASSASELTESAFGIDPASNLPRTSACGRRRRSWRDGGGRGRPRTIEAGLGKVSKQPPLPTQPPVCPVATRTAPLPNLLVS